MARLLACLSVLFAPVSGVAAQPSVHAAEPDATPTIEAATAIELPPRETSRDPSRSVGRPNAGRLPTGVELLPTTSLHIKPSPQNGHFGTAELVSLLTRAADEVAARFPGSQLTVGDLSRRGGGRISPHRSHQSGLDADVGFFLLDADARPVLARSFVNVGPDLASYGATPGYTFDLPRNWALIAALVSDPDVQIQYIFVADYVRTALLEEAVRQGSAPELVERASSLLEQPRGSPHRSHFHVRIYCPPSDRPECVDEPPYHPWYRKIGDGEEFLPDLGPSKL